MSKYGIIYADPPWHYEKSGGTKNSRGLAKSFYPTMPIAELKELPLKDLADDNCVLFMWATFPKLPEALELIKEWGFIYQSVAFTWVKKTVKGLDFVGMGYWTRANPEVCLLAIKGKPKPVSHSVRQLVYAPLGRHSEKPHEIRTLIEQLVGDVPRIELFARHRTRGWDVWGNQVPEEYQPLQEKMI